MGKTGTMKLAPKKLKDKVATQFCIDGYFVNEVLDDLPKGVSIIGAKVIMGSTHLKRKVPVSNSLKRLGVQVIHESTAAQQAIMVFDEVSGDVIKSKIGTVARNMGLNKDLAFFKYITLHIKGATGKFEHCTKEIKPDETDLRKKLRVMGLTDAEGKVSDLIKALGAKKYQCTIQHEQVRTIICSNMS